MTFHKHFTSLLLLLISFFATKSLSFNLEEVADKIYVHFGFQEDANKINKGDISNIGFIVGDKSILVIDTGGTPSIGESLYKKINDISSLPISYVVITHSHPDHYFGTNVFINKSIDIIGHSKLQRSLDANFEFYKNLQLVNTRDQSVKEFENFKITKFVNVEKNLTIDLGNRVVEIKAWPSGHTDNDLSIFDKKTRTLWTENIFIRRTPSIRASVKGWKKNLEETSKMDVNLIIPGHGPVKKKDEALEPMLSYFNRLIDNTRKFHKNNISLSKAIENFPSQNMENWLLYNIYHPSNITKVYTELEWE
tara:strand:- start:107 stop:1030 length:924 start_codon:yes stop_codon:yes gene_type:complete